jgi:hypothetical protein
MKMAPRLRHKKQPGAFKHGGYSALGLLPGESPAEFEQLHEDLAEELAPRGPLEEDIVSTLARLLWRKQNRSTFRTAEFARNRLNAIIREEITPETYPSLLPSCRSKRKVKKSRRPAKRRGAWDERKLKRNSETSIF